MVGIQVDIATRKDQPCFAGGVAEGVVNVIVDAVSDGQRLHSQRLAVLRRGKYK